jgi:hypothetical protein
MMLQRRPMESEKGADSAADQRCGSKNYGVAERVCEGQTLPEEELGQEDHEAEDQRVDRDQAPAADQQALQDRWLKHCRGRKLLRRERRLWRRQRSGRRANLILDRFQESFSFSSTTL